MNAYIDLGVPVLPESGYGLRASTERKALGCSLRTVQKVGRETHPTWIRSSSMDLLWACGYHLEGFGIRARCFDPWLESSWVIFSVKGKWWIMPILSHRRRALVVSKAITATERECKRRRIKCWNKAGTNYTAQAQEIFNRAYDYYEWQATEGRRR